MNRSPLSSSFSDNCGVCVCGCQSPPILTPAQMAGTVRIAPNTANVREKKLLAQLQLIDEGEETSDLFSTPK